MTAHNTSIQKLYQSVRKYRGTIGEISSRSGRSREWVLLVLKGKYLDTQVINMANKVLTERHRDAAKAVQAAADVVIATRDIDPK